MDYTDLKVSMPFLDTLSSIHIFSAQ